MTIHDLYSCGLAGGMDIKVISAKSGRVLIHKYKPSVHRRFSCLRLWGVTNTIDVCSQGGFAKPLLVAYAYEEEYNRLKLEEV